MFPKIIFKSIHCHHDYEHIIVWLISTNAVGPAYHNVGLWVPTHSEVYMIQVNMIKFVSY